MGKYRCPYCGVSFNSLAVLTVHRINCSVKKH